MPKVLKIRSLHNLQCLQKNMWDEVDSLPADKTESFLLLKFAISLQYLKENVKDEVDFLPADKHQRLLQIDTIVLGVCGQACPNYPK